MLARFAGARVFVVDDNPSNVALLRAVLTRAGIRQVFTDTDPRRVVSRLPVIDPDLLILDLHMPRLDGDAVLEQVHRFAVRDYLPVLVVTADTTAAASDRALSAGAHDFLTKPFNTNEVLLRVRNLLETRVLFTALRSASALGGDTPQVERLIVRGAMELIGGDHAMIAVPADPAAADESTELRVTVSAGTADGALGSRVVPIAESPAWAALREGMPQRVADLTTVVAGGPTGWCGPALLCPLGSRPALDAVLVTSRVPGSAAFADHDLKLLAMFAAQAGLALQRAEHQRA